MIRRLELSLFAILGLLASEAAAFAPPAAAHARPATTSLPSASDDSSSGIVPVNDSTVQFSAGAAGTLLGLFVGGPVLGGIVGVASNYLARKDVGAASEAVRGVSGGAIGAYNSAVVGLGGKAVVALEEGSPDVADALNAARKKMDEYDVVGVAGNALATVGDLAETAIDKALSFADEQGLADKARSAVGEARSAADKAVKSSME